jgi:hypothetical protein
MGWPSHPPLHQQAIVTGGGRCGSTAARTTTSVIPHPCSTTPHPYINRLIHPCTLSCILALSLSHTTHHTPYTIHQTPYTIHHTPCTTHQHHTPYILASLHHCSPRYLRYKGGSSVCIRSGGCAL